MLTSTLPSPGTAWRVDPAIFLSITGGDISLVHTRREEGVCGAALLWVKIPVRAHGIQMHRASQPVRWTEERGEEESLKFRSEMGKKVIKPVWHNKDTSHTHAE